MEREINIMKNIEKMEIRKFIDKTMKNIRSIDRIFDFRTPMPMERFLQHVRGGEIEHIKVISISRFNDIHDSGSFVPFVTYRLSFETEYRSFDRSSMYREKSDEPHADKQSYEVSEKEVEILKEQNIVTAQKRAEELRVLFPGIKIILNIPGEKDPKKRIDELQQRGIKPFIVKPLEI